MAYEFIRPPEYWEMRKEKEMAGIKQIGQHEVTEIKRNSARVGCTKVNRIEVESLLKEMDSAPKEFEILDKGITNEWIRFVMQGTQAGGGWVAVSEDETAGYKTLGYVNKSASFCIEKSVAAKLFEFLGGALGFESYQASETPYRILFRKF